MAYFDGGFFIEILRICPAQKGNDSEFGVKGQPIQCAI